MLRLAPWLLVTLCVCVRAMAQSAADRPLVIENLVCRGNVSTSCTFILGQVYLAEGDAVDEEELQNAQLRLLFLRNFRSVSIYLEKGSTRGKARVVVEVIEAKPVTTELAYQLFEQDTSAGQSLSGRITNYNLFGSGKILDARAHQFMTFSGPTIHETFARVQYIDPHLFDSKRNFFSAGASYVDGTFARSNGDRTVREQVSYDVTIGRRLWDFSYFTLGYQYRPVINLNANTRQEDGRFETVDALRPGVLVWGYGWNSEDDAYFPTRGSRLDLTVLAAGSRYEDRGAFYRHNWRWGRTVLSASFQSDDTFGVGFARPLSPPLAPVDSVRRGRWFTGLVIAPSGFDAQGTRLRSLGVTTGILLETTGLGIVRLQLSYSKELNQ